MSESVQEPKYEAVEPSKRLLACVAGILVPGAGHFILGRRGRGILFLICIHGMLLTGLLMHGHVYRPTDTDRLSLLYFISDLGVGLLYPILNLFNIGRAFQPQLTTFEAGTNFIAVAGLLNYLVIPDIFDIASGRKN